jgi:uncharacterized protein YqeY
MSELKAKLLSDIKEAMKAKQKESLVTLRGLSAAVKQIEVDTRADVDDAMVVDIVRKEIKKRRDAIEFAEKAGRSEMVAQNESEIALLENYLGDQLSAEELESLIKSLIDGGADNIGAVMGVLNKEHKGKFEGRVASTLVKKHLG